MGFIDLRLRICEAAVFNSSRFGRDMLRNLMSLSSENEVCHCFGSGNFLHRQEGCMTTIVGFAL